MQEIMKDFIQTLNSGGELVEVAMASVGSSKFNRAMYLSTLNEEDYKDLLKQKMNLAFCHGFGPKLRPTTQSKEIIARIGQDSFVDSKSILSFDLDFKDNYENVLFKESTNEYIAKKITEILKSHHLSPWMIVFSGNGLHLHYKFAQAQKIESIQNYKFIYDAIRSYIEHVTHFKLDPSCCNPARLMRLPFSTNWKDEHNPIRTEVMFHDKNNDFSHVFSRFSQAIRPQEYLKQDSSYLDKKKIIENLDFIKILDFFSYSKQSSIKDISGRIICSSPFRKDSNPSFYFDKNKKLFFDFSSSQGGDCIWHYRIESC